VALDSVSLLPPVPAPQHVFAAPANYRKHIGELGRHAVTKGGRSAREQGFFLKAPGSLVGAGGSIRLPRDSTRRFDHEAELAVVIGRAGRNVPRAQAMQYVFGYACLIDATMRIEPGVAEEERSMRKSFETFTPLGPWLVTADEVPDPQALSNRLWVNDELRQDANTRDMIVGIAELIELVSSVLPLQPGDVIATGTPEGVGPFAPGDRVRIAIEGVGEMTLPVQAHEQRAPRAY
jgi:2-keto-4-pentenoate hydratase/2-oxohepta-3-ene-1,7-dioic acid hydratase in catechol pathway